MPLCTRGCAPELRCDSVATRTLALQLPMDALLRHRRGAARTQHAGDLQGVIPRVLRCSPTLRRARVAAGVQGLEQRATCFAVPGKIGQGNAACTRRNASQARQ